MCKAESQLTKKTPATVTDGSGALSLHWYVAYTRVNYERRGAQYISKSGFETYVATQKEWHQWSDRRKLVDHIVIPMIVFVRCTAKDAERLERLSFIAYFMRIPGTRHKATIPEDQIERLRFTLDNSDSAVIFTSEQFKKGDMVRIRFGKLTGLTGNVAYSKDGSPNVVINLDYLGCATVKVKAEDLEPIHKTQ